MSVCARDTCRSEAFGSLDRTASIEEPVVGKDVYTEKEKAALKNVAVALSAGWALDQVRAVDSGELTPQSGRKRILVDSYEDEFFVDSLPEPTLQR